MFEGLQIEKDSDDLSSEEVSRAVAAPNVEAVIAALREIRCSLCLKSMGPRSHELRRKNPHYYWRAWLICEADHNETRVFRTDWLHGST
jgi:hypothetical protein